MAEKTILIRRGAWLGLGSVLALIVLLAIGITYVRKGKEVYWEGPPGLLRWVRATAPEIPSSPELLARGHQLYGVHCATCHGAHGDGKGPGSLFLAIPPRDFTRGVYKFRTTPQEGMPADMDLFRTITAGLPAYGMPSFRTLPEEERWALVHYIKSLYPKWELFGQPEVVAAAVAEPPFYTGSLERGKELYEKKYKCSDCHGLTGRGDGSRSHELEDQWKRPISPRDFTLGPAFLKMGWHREDGVRMLVTGIPGTPMPSQVDQLPDPADLSEFWDIALYVEQLQSEAQQKKKE